MFPFLVTGHFFGSLATDFIVWTRVFYWKIHLPGTYTSRYIPSKLHITGIEWHIFHILMSEDINDFIDIKFVS